MSIMKNKKVGIMPTVLQKFHSASAEGSASANSAVSRPSK